MDGFVFWTKNLIPFMDVLAEVESRRYPFVVQYTINGYPRALESRVVDPGLSIRNFKQAASVHGTRSMVWRYDTVILTTITNRQFHVSNFRMIAKSLSGWTDEVVVSFLQVYKKTRRNLNQSGRDHGFVWQDPSVDEKKSLLTDFVSIAAENRMHVTVCSQPELIIAGSKEASCVDAERLMTIAGKPICALKKGNRKECACYQARDVGDYDTCPHGCVYCYAVRDRGLALQRYKDHDPLGEYLHRPSFMPDPGNGPHSQLELPLN